MKLHPENRLHWPNAETANTTTRQGSKKSRAVHLSMQDSLANQGPRLVRSQKVYFTISISPSTPTRTRNHSCQSLS